MGILSAAYQALRTDIYSRVPEVQCRACGECCVSPHMTLIEFCYLMTHLLDKPDQLIHVISREVPEHPAYSGHFICRFQTPDLLCSVYPTRSLACRLHGHPVLEQTGMQYNVHCPKVNQQDDAFSAEEVYALMDRMTELNQGYYSYYTPPYWVSGLNTECWMTILFGDFPQQIFQLLRKIIMRELNLQHLSGHFVQRVRLDEKLSIIDQFQTALPMGNKDKLCPLLKRIQHDFPDSGAYYYFEAEMYLKALEEKRSSL